MSIYLFALVEGAPLIYSAHHICTTLELVVKVIQCEGQMDRVWRGLGPDSGFGFGFFFKFGFGSVSALGVRIRIGFGTRGSDSDRFRHRQVRIRNVSISIGSDSDRRLVRFGFGFRTRGLFGGAVARTLPPAATAVPAAQASAWFSKHSFLWAAHCRRTLLRSTPAFLGGQLEAPEADYTTPML